MRKAVAGLVLLVSSLTGCTSTLENYERPNPFENLPVQSQSETDRFNEAYFRAIKIRYCGSDRWQSPQETERLGTGMCKDIAVYLEYLLEKEKITARIVFGKVHKKSKNYHAWNEVFVDGRCYIVDATYKITLPKEEM